MSAVGTLGVACGPLLVPVEVLVSNLKTHKESFYRFGFHHSAHSVYFFILKCLAQLSDSITEVNRVLHIDDHPCGINLQNKRIGSHTLMSIARYRRERPV